MSLGFSPIGDAPIGSLSGVAGAEGAAALVGVSTLTASGVVGSSGTTGTPVTFPPIPHITETKMGAVGWQHWFHAVGKKLSGAAQIAWSQISFTGSNLAHIEKRLHNDLQAIQGGAAGDAYHLLKVHSDLFVSGTANQVLHGSATVPTWSAVDLAADVTGTLPATNGGTGISTYLTGDLIYSSATNTLSKLAGNTTTTKKFLTQTGNGAISAAPSWGTIVTSDLSAVIPSLSAGITTEPSVTDNGDGTITLGSHTCSYFADANGSLPLTSHTGTGEIVSLTDNSINYVVLDASGVSPVIAVLTSKETINHTTIHPMVTVYRTGTHLDILTWNHEGLALANKLVKRFVRTHRFDIEPGGLVLNETATNDVTVTQGYLWNGANRALLTAFTSVSDELSLHVHVAGVWTKSTITAYNITQYDDGTDLQTLSAGKYAVNWVFRSASTNHVECHIVLGSGNYNLSQAQQSVVPGNLPDEIDETAILVGRIIVLKSAATATQIDSAFTQNFASGGVSDHSLLSNLAWSASAHTGTASNLAGFDGAGAAAYYPVTDFAAALTADQNYVTDAQLVVVTNTSGTNTGDSATPAETATTIGALIGGAADATPNDTDFVATSLTAGGVLKKITWTNVKAFLKTYFDTFYVSLSTTRREVLSAARTYYVGSVVGDTTITIASPCVATKTTHGLSADDPVVFSILPNMKTVTITEASPGVVTWVGHGFSTYVSGTGQPIVFSSTGKLSYGIIAGTTYFVKDVTGDTFTISATAGGAAIATTALTNTFVDGNTTVTVSGTHSLEVGQIIMFSGTSVVNVANATAYYVLSTPAATTFTFSATNGGTAVTPGAVTTQGTFVANGTHYGRCTGTLPTEITQGTVYYVSATGLTADEFQFSATVGGASINTSGSQAGIFSTHTGNDTNDGLAQTRAGAFLTIQKAIDTVASLDVSIYTVLIQLGDGTYSSTLNSLKSITGSGAVTIGGNAGTPSNVVVSTSGNTFIATNAVGSWVLQNMQLSASGANCVYALGAPSNITLGAGLIFSTASASHIRAQTGGYVVSSGSNYMVTAASARHMFGNLGGITNINSITVTLTDTPAFSTAFAVSATVSAVQASSISFSGSSTWSKYSATLNGVLSTAGATLPGNAAGTTATGGQYA